MILKERNLKGAKSQGSEILRSEIFELEVEIACGHHASYNHLAERV